MAAAADIYEQEARKGAWALEAAGKLPAGFTAHHYPLTRTEQLELRRLKAAGAAATDADTFVALSRGEAVPAHRLRRDIVRSHTRRTAA